MSFRRVSFSVLPYLSSFFLFSCTHTRDNPYDPAGTKFSPLVVAANFSAKSLSPDSIELHWRDLNGREEGYVVLRSRDSLHFTRLAVLKPDADRFTDTACSSYSTYFYRVGVFDKLGDTLYTNPLVRVRTLYHNPTEMGLQPELPAPAAFSITRVTADKVRLSWRKSSTPTAGYVVRRALHPDSLHYRSTVAANDSTFIDSIPPDSTCFFSVQSFDTLGLSPLAGDSITPMAAPSNLQTYLANTRDIRLFWTGNKKTTDSLVIERAADSLAPFTYFVRIPRGTTDYLDTNLTSLTHYFYRVAAFSGSLRSAYSNQISLMVKVIRPPVVDSSTVVYFPCNDTAGNRLTDATGFKHHGVIHGATPGPGQFSTGLWTGKDKYASSAHTFLCSDTALMVDFWMKPAHYLDATSETQGLAAAFNGPFRIIYLQGRLTVDFISVDQTPHRISANYYFLPNKWTHVAAVYSLGNKAIYIDGNLKILENDEFLLMPMSDSIFVGRADVGADLRYFEGGLDEFRIKMEPDAYFK